MRSMKEAGKKIETMYDFFGHCEDKDAICKNCEHLCSYTANRKWYKCECYGKSSSDATDWRIGWLACGLFNKPYDGKPVMLCKQRKRKKDGQIEGQMEFLSGG